MKNRPKEWSGKSRGGSFGYKFFILLICRIGIRPAYAFLSLVVLYFIPFAPKATKTIWRYNRQILGYGPFKSAVKLYVHYYTFGQTLIDKIAISNGLSRKYEYEFDNYGKFVELLNRGPVIIIGAHVGCWEAGTVFFGDYASRLNIVMYDGEYRKIKDALSACGAGYKVVPVNDGGIEPLLRIKQAVDNGEYICFQGDRYMDERNTRQVVFMDGKARFPEGPFLIASKFGTPVIIYFAMRNSGMKYRFKFTVIKPGLTRDEILEKYVASLEAIVRQYPQQWFNFFDLWQQK